MDGHRVDFRMGGMNVEELSKDGGWESNTRWTMPKDTICKFIQIIVWYRWAYPTPCLSPFHQTNDILPVYIIKILCRIVSGGGGQRLLAVVSGILDNGEGDESAQKVFRDSPSPFTPFTTAMTIPKPSLFQL